MAFEWEKHEDQEVVVEHLYSPVVEVISFLASFEKPEQENKRMTAHNDYLDTLDKKAKVFLSEWNARTDWSFTFLFNFLIPCPYFYDIELFHKQVSTLSSSEFLYHFFGESIPYQQLEEFVQNPLLIMEAETNIWWETEEKRQNMTEFISNLEEFRSGLFQFLLNAYESEVFQKEMSKRRSLVDQTLDRMKSMEMEPLALAQFIMGKTFRRTSLYRMYYYIPSYFFSSYRMRIFNPKICIVIYGVHAPLVDLRETSGKLELQLKALSDRNRLLMLRMLSGKKEYGAKIAEYLGITTATVSHHLELLKKAGFVKEEKVGTIKYFTLNNEHTEETLKQLQDFIKPNQ